MEDEQDCGYDFIEVFSGYDDTGPSYGRFCGNKVIDEKTLGLYSFILESSSSDEYLIF